MKNLLLALITSLSLVGFTQKSAVPYLDQDGLECILSWNTSTGNSELYFYQPSTVSFAMAGYQLPSNALGSGGYQLSPYLDMDGVECVLAWNESTGASKLYFYDADVQAFQESPYQLPSNPTGDAGKFHMETYLDQDGLECILVTNITTGSSKLYFYSADSEGFALSPYQLPTKPTEDEGTYYCIPYLDMDGVECVLTYNSKTGKSILYFYSADTKAFEKSPYQLETKPTGDAGDFHFRPYLDQDGLECVLAFNKTTGSSKLYFYSAENSAFALCNYQLPSSPTGDSGKYGFWPYLDQNGLECVLVWNYTTGKSVLYFYSTESKQFVVANYQLGLIK